MEIIFLLQCIITYVITYIYNLYTVVIQFHFICLFKSLRVYFNVVRAKMAGCLLTGARASL